MTHWPRRSPGSAVVVFENRYRCKDGSYRWLLWNASTLADGRIYGTARDVTDRKQMDDELHTSRERALEASRLKSEFLANMSHEIRTPLNGVVCMSELLLEQDLTGEQREYAQVAMTSAEALMTVINDILDFSKIEAGKLDIVTEDFSIEAAVGDVCEIVRGKAHENRTELAVSIAEDVPDIVRGDSNRVRQVLINLVSNAVKFTSGGEVLVRVAPRAGRGRPTERLRLEVSDTGIGIDPERQRRPLPGVLPRRQLQHPPLRRRGPGAVDRQAAGGADGRRDRGPEPAGRGQHVLAHDPLRTRGRRQ